MLQRLRLPPMPLPPKDEETILSTRVSSLPRLEGRARRRRASVAAVVAVALVLGVGLGLWRPWKASIRPELGALVAAAANVRPTDARLTGGFAWAAVRSPVRGASSNVSVDILVAAGRLRQFVDADRSAINLAALGTAHLFIGDIDAAVSVFEEASVLDHASPIVWSDLAAAYLARAAEPRRAADLARALDAAETAVTLDGSLPEAHFNKALVLARLGLRSQAAAAWTRYLSLDAASAWAGEARERLAAVHAPASQTSTDLLSLREALFDEALPAWISASAGVDGASAHQRVKALEAKISGGSADRFAHAVIANVSSRTAASAAPGRQEAIGFASYAAARAAYKRDDFEAAQPAFDSAYRALSSIRSPLALSVQLHLAIIAYRQTRYDAAAALLGEARRGASDRFDSLLGRIDWVEGLLHAVQGRRALAIASYESALGRFRAAVEPSNEAFVHGLLSTQFELIGDLVRSWESRLLAIAGSAREGPLLAAGFASSRQDWHHAAGIFAEASAAAARSAERPPTLADALRWRAITAAKLGREADARDFLRQAIGLIEGRTGAAWTRLRAETSLATAVTAGKADAAAGIAAATAAIAYFEAAGTIGRLPEIYRERARLHHLQGNAAAAETDLRRGLDLLTRTREHVPRGADQATFTDVVRGLVEDLVTLKAAHGATDELFAIGEAARGRDLPGAGDAPLSLQDLQDAIPPHVVVVSYVVGEETSHGWAVRKGDKRFARIDAGRQDLMLLGAALGASRFSADAAARVRRLVLEPFASLAAPDDLIVIVPDGPLHAIPWAALPGRTAKYLIEEHPVIVAPSAAAWWRASKQRGAPVSTAGALVIGNPKIPALFSNLANLPHAEAEAVAVAAIYGQTPLLGEAVTRASLLDRLTHARVVHFAGHALVNVLNPLQSQLVIADPSGQGFTAGDIRAVPMQASRLVVLSACEAVGGLPTRSEGPIGLARAFLAAGVPTVIASQWVAPDRPSRELFVRFHQSFVETGDAARALRAAQIALLRSGDPALADPAAWAGFIVIGGG
jgi:tetratricopeptide (TPR) repeat protein